MSASRDPYRSLFGECFGILARAAEVPSHTLTVDALRRAAAQVPSLGAPEMQELSGDSRAVAANSWGDDPLDPFLRYVLHWPTGRVFRIDEGAMVELETVLDLDDEEEE